MRIPPVPRSDSHGLSSPRTARRGAAATFALALLLAVGPLAGCTQDEGASTRLMSLSELERGCVVTAACGIQARPRVSNCIDYYFDVLVDVGLGPVYTDVYRCVLEAGSDCTAVSACFGQTGGCTRTDFTAYCKGDRAYTCDLLDQKVYALSCGIAGLSCAKNPIETFAAVCVCDGSFAPRCHGNYAVHCVDGQIDAENCTSSGTVCQGGACAKPSNAPACDAQQFSPRCDGAVAVRCAEGKEVREDCTQRLTNRRCEGGACVRTGTACGDDFNRCKPNGDLEACIDGSWRTFSCSQMGLGDCREGFYGANCARFN